jgi:GT2 family glycosyltransferase/glycosyltransferase involved in cell wall biosynthesis
MISYRAPTRTQKSTIDGRPVLSTVQGGKIAIDATLLSLWEYAAGRTLDEILASFQAEYATQQTIRAALACLCQAGLLEREGVSASAPALPEAVSGPLVSAVIVGYNSRDWLVECLPSLQAQTYAPIETIVVDNGSQDGTLPWLEANYPQVKTVRLDPPVPLSSAINRGVSLASRDSLLLVLNPDIRLEPDAVAQMVVVALSDPACAAVGAKLRFWWAPSFLNGLGNQVGPFSWGTDNAIGHLDLGQFDHWEELPSACFAATLINRAAWQAVGPVDESFPMYYEDVEWCYRARLSGHKILPAPQAIIYHAFGGKVPGGQADTLSPAKLRNVVYGRYRFAIKLTGAYLARFISNYWVEDWTNVGRHLLKLNWKMTAGYLQGWLAVLRGLPELRKSRKVLQSQRKLSDSDLFAFQRSIPAPLIWHSLPELTWDLIIQHYLPLIMSGRTQSMPETRSATRRPQLLIVSNDVVDEKMAGPGMRYLELARALAGDIDVTLAVPSATSLQIDGLQLVRYWEERPTSLQVLVDNSDIALVSTYMVNKFPFLSTTHTRLVVDLYDPTVLENLHYYLNEPISSQQALNQHGVATTNQLLKLGDYFICGNERQRDFWLGWLTAIGRVNPLTFKNDTSLRNLIDVVGIGFPDRELQPGDKLLRGVHPEIPPDARIILWGGGIWNWLDPLTLIRAWPEVVQKHPEARLVFLGTRHPNPLVPAHEMAQKAQQLAAEIGEKDRTIIFIEWVSYQERETLLSEADIGVALHPIHVETRYSIRTRMLDYLWARLPILVTDGDITSEWVRQYNLGVVVPPFETHAVAAGLNALLDKQKKEFAQAFEPLFSHFRWSQVVEPLQRYCLEGTYAPDRLDRTAQPEPESLNRSNLARAIYILKTEGLKALLHRAWRHLQWRLSRP